MVSCGFLLSSRMSNSQTPPDVSPRALLAHRGLAPLAPQPAVSRREWGDLGCPPP